MAIPSDATAPGSPVARLVPPPVTADPIDRALAAFQGHQVPAAEDPPLVLSFMLALSAVLQGRKATRQSWGNPADYMVLKNEFLMLHREGVDHNFILHRLDAEGMDWMLL